MKKRRRSFKSTALLSDNESLDIFSSPSPAEPLTTAPTSPTPSTALLPATTTAAYAISAALVPATTTEAYATSAALLPATTTATTTSDGTILATTLKSDVWEYFHRCVSIGPLKAKCLKCDKELLTPNYGTSSLKRHLIQIHGLKQFNSTEVTHSSTTTVSLSKTEKEKLDSLAVDAIIKDARTFGDFQKPGFKKFIDTLRPGYKPPNRAFVVKKLKRLHQQHTHQTKTQFEEANFLSATCDFWKSRQGKSFLVITGHYVDKNFDEHSKILTFMTFEDRHFSLLIAQEIERQLISLGLYDKLITITTDGAPNMRQMFDYFTRRNIRYIHCVAHKFHLIICNGLNLWVSLKKKRATKNVEEVVEGSTDEDDYDDTQHALDQMIRSMSVDIDLLLNEENDTENENNNTSTANDDVYDEVQSDNDMVHAASNEEEEEEEEEAEGWIDENHDDETTDNFIEGVNTEEILLDDLQKKVRGVIDITREIVKTAKRTTILSNFIEKKRLKINLNRRKDKKINRHLSIDVKTRWNSTFKMLSTINIYRDIINEMFKSKGSLGLTAKQRRKLTRIELTTDQWDLLELLVMLLQPFYSATKVLSNAKYPTIGSALYVIRRLQEQLETEENNAVLNVLKAMILTKFRYYMFDNKEQFDAIKLYGYFDPMGYSVLTRQEQAAVEKELIKIYKKDFEAPASSTSSSGNQQTTRKISNVDKAWEGFLKDTNTNLQQGVPTIGSIQDEINLYRNLATKL